MTISSIWARLHKRPLLSYFWGNPNPVKKYYQKENNFIEIKKTNEQKILKPH